MISNSGALRILPATFNRKKFQAVLLYLLAHSPKQTIEGKKKLAKLLYFSDFNFFEAFEQPLTGATYKALHMGPFPEELDTTLASIAGEGKQIGISKKPTGLQNDAVVYKLTIEPDSLSFDDLTKNERRVLDKVITELGGMSGKALEDLSHREAPYNAVVQGERIPYELAYYRGKTKEELLGT
jgi:uncharacterized phage-associated protein